MPACKHRGLYHDQRVPPVEPAGEPDQDHADGIGPSSRCDVALLIQSELFAQQEILCGEGRAWAYAETKETHAVV